jgi:ZIP family zinc transporter
MATGTAATTAGWGELLREHARRNAGATLAAAVALVASLALLVQGFDDASAAAVRLALLGGAVAFAATALGAAPALVVRELPQKVEDTLLGWAAGMMLAAAAFSLLLPGLAAAEALTGSPRAAGGVVVVGMTLGVLLMLGLDRFTPHEHERAGPCGPGHDRCGRLWLFVFAIALHNLPEGMAIGVGFAQADLSVGVPLTAAIALQDAPEGLAVALALRGAGFSPWLSVLVAAGTGLLEPLGALVGVSLGSGLAIAYPIGLGLAAGAMIFVVSHEVIPETHRNGHQTAATLGLMVGFALMMVLDTSLR